MTNRNRNHGSPYDRGAADSYYHRGRDPHWWPEGTGHGRRIEAHEMTPEELREYETGFVENEECGNFKDWG